MATGCVIMFFLPAHTRACSRFADVSSAGVPAAPVFKSNGKALSKMEAEKLQLALEKHLQEQMPKQLDFCSYTSKRF